MLLTVVNPSDDGDDTVHEALVVHAVLAMEADGLRIDATEQVEGVDGGVLIAKETVYALAVFVVNAQETLF